MPDLGQCVKAESVSVRNTMMGRAHPKAHEPLLAREVRGPEVRLARGRSRAVPETGVLFAEEEDHCLCVRVRRAQRELERVVIRGKLTGVPRDYVREQVRLHRGVDLFRERLEIVLAEVNGARGARHKHPLRPQPLSRSVDVDLRDHERRRRALLPRRRSASLLIAAAAAAAGAATRAIVGTAAVETSLSAAAAEMRERVAIAIVRAIVAVVDVIAASISRLQREVRPTGVSSGRDAGLPVSYRMSYASPGPHASSSQVSRRVQLRGVFARHLRLELLRRRWLPR